MHPSVAAWPGGAEHGAAQPTSPALSWVLWMDAGVLRTSPKSCQNTQPLRLGTFHSKSAHCLQFPHGGVQLSSPQSWEGAWGVLACLGWSQHWHN